MRRYRIARLLLVAGLASVPISGVTARLAKPVAWGSPDQPYGKRRPVTDADRAAVRAYRNGGSRPIFATNFNNPAEFAADWQRMSDDAGKICRTPANVEVSSEGLRLKTMIATDCRGHQKWSTGSIRSKRNFLYGYFEATMKIADVPGMNNAFWMNTGNQASTKDYFEIDVCEVQYPSYDHIGLQQYPAKTDGVARSDVAHTGLGWGAYFVENLSSAFHDYGVLRTPREMIFVVDGAPVAAVVTNTSVIAPADVMFSSALIYMGVPDHPEGHDMQVKSLRVFAL